MHLEKQVRHGPSVHTYDPPLYLRLLPIFSFAPVRPNDIVLSRRPVSSVSFRPGCRTRPITKTTDRRSSFDLGGSISRVHSPGSCNATRFAQGARLVYAINEYSSRTRPVCHISCGKDGQISHRTITAACPDLKRQSTRLKIESYRLAQIVRWSGRIKDTGLVPVFVKVWVNKGSSFESPYRIPVVPACSKCICIQRGTQSSS